MKKWSTRAEKSVPSTLVRLLQLPPNPSPPLQPGYKIPATPAVSQKINWQKPNKYTTPLSSSLLSFFFCSFELANPHQEELAETDSPNRRVVLALYQALTSLDVSTVHKILAPDLEWWFHGPPSHQFLMRLLTGANSKGFSFQPLVITSFGPIVLAEGCDPTRSIYWVHAWTVSDAGIITQVREYFNTSLTVTRVGDHSASSSSSSSEISKVHHCTSVWESSLSERAGKSVPGLVLAI